MVQSAISYIRSIAFGGPNAPPPSNDDIPAYKKGSRDGNGQYEPSPVDVFIVREMLANFTKLPVDVVEVILDMAEYWPHSEAKVEVGNGIEWEGVAWGGGGQQHEDTFLMRTYPIGMLDSHGGNLQIHGSSAKPQTPAPKPPQPDEYLYNRQTGRPDTRFPIFGRRMRMGRSLIAQPVSDNPAQPTQPPNITGPTSRRVAMPIPPPVDADLLEPTPAAQPAESAPQDVDQSKSAAYSQADSFEAPDADLFAKLANYPLPSLLSPVRKIVFKIRSRDQGHTSSTPPEHLPFHGSWTWFEAGLEKLDEKDAVSNSPDGKSTLDIKAEALRCVIPGPRTENNERVYNFVLLPDDKMLVQKNRAGEKEWHDHEVVWRYTDYIDPESDQGIALERDGRGKASGTGEFVRSLEVGDVVTLWAKARFPGWRNNVEMASVKVYWAL